SDVVLAADGVAGWAAVAKRLTAGLTGLTGLAKGSTIACFLVAPARRHSHGGAPESGIVVAGPKAAGVKFKIAVAAATTTSACQQPGQVQLQRGAGHQRRAAGSARTGLGTIA